MEENVFLESLKNLRGLELAGFIIIIIGFFIMNLVLPMASLFSRTAAEFSKIIIGNCDKVCMPGSELFLFSGGIIMFIGMALLLIGHIIQKKPFYNPLKVWKYGWSEKSIIKRK